MCVAVIGVSRRGAFAEAFFSLAHLIETLADEFLNSLNRCSNIHHCKLPLR